jgi:hypothetical protein
VTVRVVLLTHRVAVDGMGVPLHAPAAVDVAVVLPQPEEQRAGERGDERDVGEWPAHAATSFAGTGALPDCPDLHGPQRASSVNVPPALADTLTGFGISARVPRVEL